MDARVSALLLLATLMTHVSHTQLKVHVDAQKDSIYSVLSSPQDGYLRIPHTAYIPFSGQRPEDDADLSAELWFLWDERFLYMYAEVKDETLLVNNAARPQNDCVELKFDPDPSTKALVGTVNARLTALDSAGADLLQGVDNLYPEGDFTPLAANIANYARRRTPDGYAIEMRLAWAWIRTGNRTIAPEVGRRFGFAVNIHDNDEDRRTGSLQWSAGMGDEIWLSTGLLGTVELRGGHRLALIPRNLIYPEMRPGMNHISRGRFYYGQVRPYLVEGWKYHAGDDSTWKDPDLDDTAWELAYPRLRSPEQPPGGWQEIGWFRAHIVVDSSLRGVPLAAQMLHVGASEVYLNGRLLYMLGTIGYPDQAEQGKIERNILPLVFDPCDHQVLAVRYAVSNASAIDELTINSGFDLVLSDQLPERIRQRVDEVRKVTLFQAAFTVLPAFLGLLHLSLYLFFPRGRENLFFALFLLMWGVVVWTSLAEPFLDDFPHMLLYIRAQALAFSLSLVFGLAMVYTLAYRIYPKWFYPVVVAAAGLTFLGVLQLGEDTHGFIRLVALSLTALEIARVFLIRRTWREEEHWLLGIGLAGFLLTLVWQLLYSAGVVPRVGEFGAIYLLGVLFLSITVSIHLSRTFARTNRRLEQQLVQVEELSRKTIEQERRAAAEKVALGLLEADNRRKTAELEEAHRIQLAMLPSTLPTVLHLELAFHMQPATEVGGDYYDYHLREDGSLTLAVGDATGHGMKAGTMVAAVKGLFSAFGTSLDFLPFLAKCTETIHDMHLGNLYMGLTLVNVRPDRLVAASAGMPPILIFRKETHQVEELVMKGMPLGAHRGFPYVQREAHLAPGDTILLMSDGLGELFNDREEMFDHERVKSLLLEAGHCSPAQIIQRLTQAAEQWSGGQPHNDDITLVVAKVRNGAPPI